MSKLDQVVFVIENGKIVESKIRDLTGFIETTTTPAGVGPTFHVRENELWTWGLNFPRKVGSFDTAAEAQAALEETFFDDFMKSTEILWFVSREKAERFLADELKGSA